MRGLRDTCWLAIRTEVNKTPAPDRAVNGDTTPVGSFTRSSQSLTPQRCGGTTIFDRPNERRLVMLKKSFPIRAFLMIVVVALAVVTLTSTAVQAASKGGHSSHASGQKAARPSAVHRGGPAKTSPRKVESHAATANPKSTKTQGTKPSGKEVTGDKGRDHQTKRHEEERKHKEEERKRKEERKEKLPCGNWGGR